jgi:hypothetical protein
MARQRSIGPARLSSKGLYATAGAIASSARRQKAPGSFPMPIRPDISAAVTAGLAGEPRLDIGQPDVIRPAIGASAADECAIGEWDKKFYWSGRQCKVFGNGSHCSIYCRSHHA